MYVYMYIINLSHYNVAFSNCNFVSFVFNSWPIFSSFIYFFFAQLGRGSLDLERFSSTMCWFVTNAPKAVELYDMIK